MRKLIVLASCLCATSAMAQPWSGGYTFGQLTSCVTLNPSRFNETFRIRFTPDAKSRSPSADFFAYKCGTSTPSESGFQVGSTVQTGDSIEKRKRFFKSGRVWFKVIASEPWVLTRERRRKRN